MSLVVAPSLLSADFGNLNKDVEMVNSSAAGLIHLDIMDGVFVPNISYGFPIIESVAAIAQKPLDAHLMIVEPDKYIERIAKSNVTYVSVHYEACVHLHRTLQSIHHFGMNAGVALNPHTPVSLLADIIEDCDYVLIMSVNPGFSGQSFIERTYDKIAELRAMINQRSANCLIEVDGGVNSLNAPLLKKAGADMLVAGSSVFSASDPKAVIASLSEC